MRRENITPEIIDLARKIAGHWRMEIYEGCWRTLGDKAYLVKAINTEKSDWGIPIPSISDIEKKLEDLQWHVHFCIEHIQGIDHYYLPSIWEIHVRDNLDYKKEVKKSSQSHLEALLSVLLEVLKSEEKAK